MAPSETATVQSSQKTDTSRSVGVNVTTKTETTGIGESLDLNPWYFKTVPGILKLVQLLLAIICMACASPVITKYTNFFMFVVVIFFIVTLVFCVVYFFTIKNLLPKLPWLIIELAATAIAVVLYFIAFVVQLAVSSRRDYSMALSLHNFYSAYIAAGVFALFNCIAYAAGAFFLFKEWQQSRPATSPPTQNP